MAGAGTGVGSISRAAGVGFPSLGEEGGGVEVKPPPKSPKQKQSPTGNKSIHTRDISYDSLISSFCFDLSAIFEICYF
jgi:hypothetical protein